MRSFRFGLAVLVSCGCGGQTAQPPAAPAATSSSPSEAVAPGRAAPSVPWDPVWAPVESFHGATAVFEVMSGLCAARPDGVRCEGSTELGPLATTAISSPTQIWGFVYVCGAAAGGAFVCSKPFADRPPQGPPKLEDVVSVDLHAAAHRDGALSVTANRSATGFSDPRWSKVAGVTDAVQVASSWYATTSCYLKRSGEVACVAHAPDATPAIVPGVTDAARIWKTDRVLWALTRTGRLLATRDLRASFEEVATSVVQMAPNAAAPGAVKPDDSDMPSLRPEVPCAVRRDGVLLCGLDRSWKLVPVPGAGTTRSVFGGSDWICAGDDAGTVRCIHQK
jgi:hypothetical protein